MRLDNSILKSFILLRGFSSIFISELLTFAKSAYIFNSVKLGNFFCKSFNIHVSKSIFFLIKLSLVTEVFSPFIEEIISLLLIFFNIKLISFNVLIEIKLFNTSNSKPA